MRRLERGVIGLAWLVPASGASAGIAPSFHPLPLLSGGSHGAVASVAADGSFAVGSGNSSSVPDREAAIFRPAAPSKGFGTMTGAGGFSEAFDASSDGSALVGYSSSNSGVQAMRWTQAGGMVGLGDLSGGSFFSIAFGCSADGGTAVGESSSSSGAQAFRWTQGGGMVALGDLAGGSFSSSAARCSADGSVIVGRGAGPAGPEAFRWTQGGGMVALGDLAGGAVNSAASDVSADGSIVVGGGTSALGAEAFRWTASDGMVGLGDLAGGGFSSRAWGVSGDGSVVVGSGDDGVQSAFVWDSLGGMQSVRTLLLSLGVTEVADWHLRIATAANADGTVIVGVGTDPLGRNAPWMAVIPAPGTGGPVLLLAAVVRRRREAVPHVRWPASASVEVSPDIEPWHVESGAGVDAAAGVRSG